MVLTPKGSSNLTPEAKGLIPVVSLVFELLGSISVEPPFSLLSGFDTILFI